MFFVLEALEVGDLALASFSLTSTSQGYYRLCYELYTMSFVLISKSSEVIDSKDAPAHQTESVSLVRRGMIQHFPSPY